MAAARRGYPDAEDFGTPSRRRLSDATRQLLAEVLRRPAGPRQLDAAATAVERALEVLDEPRDAAVTDAGGEGRRGPRHDDYLPRSPLIGALNPAAPPFEWQQLRDGIVARGTFGAPCEGPPGYVHGGWVALAFDEVLGLANAAAGHSGMTARLTVRYRRPTPLHREVVIEARTARVDGRRITTFGSLRVDGELTAEAEGLFVTIGAERALEYFGEPASTAEPTDPLP